jgi:hypothetical protein
MCEAGDGFGSVVLGLRDTAFGREVVDLDHLGLAALWCEDHFQGALARNDTVLGAVLVAKSVAADDDGLFPSRHEARDGGNNNRRAEDGSSPGMLSACFRTSLPKCTLQLVSNGAVGRQPHLLELELLDTLLIRSDGCALDADRVLLDSLGGIECYLVVGLITVWQTKIVVLEVNVEVGVNKLQRSVCCLQRSNLHGVGRTLSLMTCQMILVISSPSSSTTGFLTFIFLIGVDDAILYCPMCVYRLAGVALTVLAGVLRGLESWADVAADCEAKQRVAKLQVWRGDSRAIEVAERIAAGAAIAGLMAR